MKPLLEEFGDLAAEVAERHGVDPNLLAALLRLEETFPSQAERSTPTDPSIDPYVLVEGYVRDLLHSQEN